MSTFILDLDGTVYRDDVPLPGARETIEALRTAGHRVLFASNNSTHTRADYARRLGGMGLTIEPDGLATTGYATGRYLHSLPAPPRSLLVIGTQGLTQEILAAGLQARTDGVPPIDAVVVGLDRGFTFARLAAAQAAVLAGARLVATNRDPQFPGRDGITPGCGALVAAVEVAAQATAVTVGKPEPYLYQSLIEATGADPRRTVVVGDSLKSDIAAAIPLGLYNVLVLTGVSAAPAARTTPQPDLVLPSLAELIPALARARPDLLSA
jgi:HAD superfamily hydrolase (TIGR01450 family)